MNRIIILLLLLTIGQSSFADEGMWLVNLLGKLKVNEMQSKGLKLSASDIYDINNACLKDAVVALDHGCCTGEIVSSKGLMMTNHHCAFDDIQKLSTVEHDYLKNGFWAKSQSEEIPIMGKCVSFLEKVVDVTEEVKKEIEFETKKGGNNSFMMRRIFHRIEKRYNKDTDLELSCSGMFRGVNYYLYYYKTYNDVRLVGAPPSSIGAFGGDTDNWMWPQHKGDFAIYRIYGNKNGEPANYSPNNVPIKPKYVLPVSIKGVKEGDFSMVMGYPGSTKRYMSSFGVEHKLKYDNIPTIKTREAKLDVLKKEMNKSDEVRIKYASKAFGSSNVYKFLIGENKYTKKYDVVNKKRQQEAQLIKWINANAERKAEYGDVLKNLQACYENLEKYDATLNYFKEAIIGGSDIMLMAMRLKGLNTCLLKDKSDKTCSAKNKCCCLKRSSEVFFKDYDVNVDKKVFQALIKVYVDNAVGEGQSEYLNKMLKKFNGNYADLAEYVYSKSFMTTEESLYNFLDNASLKKLEKDPAYIICISILDKIYEIREKTHKTEQSLGEYKTKYVKALVEMQTDQELYPDANSTMRLTYGTVGGYSSADAVMYDYKTQIIGYLQKEDNNNSEFFVSERLKKLIKENDFGRYADDGVLNTCFVTNTDITCGNSGSPVLNGNGELIGLAFDGNWESMAGDLYFHPSYNKTVCVDVRFVLWVIDKYANASYLIDEMNIVN